MLLTLFTLFHVAISLVGIAAGFPLTYGFLANKPCSKSTAVFLTFTIATSVTGYFFPVSHLMPSHVVGAISLVVLAIAVFALYKQHLRGAWRWIYVITAMIGFYLNFFVLVAQSFAKIPPLKALAPTQSEPPFAIAQLVVMAVFIVFTILAVKKFHPKPSQPQTASTEPAI